MLRIARKKKGYTLVEVMLVLAVMGIVLAGTMGLLINFTRFWRVNQAKLDIQRDARRTLSLMNKKLRQAVQSSIVIDQVTGMPPWSRVTFTGLDSVSISYYQNGDRLYQEANGQILLLGENLKTIRFSYPSSDDGTLLGVSVCFEKATYEGGSKSLQLSIEKVRVMN
ncbi:MAG: type II secretion system protein [Candidatus Firestonebacteria bacterium]